MRRGGVGWRRDFDLNFTPPRLASCFARCEPTLPLKGRVKNHTEAVVTPPSTTMVWPVMKLEASEER